MTKQNKKIWVVMTNNGIAWVSTNTDFYGKDISGQFLNCAGKGLGFVPAFKDRKDALKFARKARRARTVTNAYIRECEVI